MSDDELFTYTYTNEGNVWTKTRQADNPTGDYLTEYTFDTATELTKILVKDYVNEDAQVVQEGDYSYDAFDRLVGRTRSGRLRPAGARSPSTSTTASTSAAISKLQTGEEPLPGPTRWTWCWPTSR